jgi:hypothetical protein
MQEDLNPLGPIVHLLSESGKDFLHIQRPERKVILPDRETGYDCGGYNRGEPA